MTGLIYPPSASIDLRGGQLKKGSLRQGYAYDGEDKKTQGRTETVNSLTLVLGSIDRMGAGRLVVETVEWRFSGDPEPFAVWHCLMRADPVRWGDRFVRRLSEDEAKALMKELGQEGEVNG